MNFLLVTGAFPKFYFFNLPSLDVEAQETPLLYTLATGILKIMYAFPSYALLC